MTALARTYAAAAQALTQAARQPTLADVHRWGVPLGKYRHFLWAIDKTWGLKPDTPVADAKAFLERKIVQEESKRSLRHHTFDANRLIATKQMLRHVSEFQARKREVA